jgi:hypothetical protein
MTAVDNAIIAYLFVHGFFAWVTDAQICLPDLLGQAKVDEIYSGLGLGGILEKWGRDHGDHLVLEKPLWFRAIVWGEICLQFPFVCFAIVAWLRRSESVRVPALCYSAHVLTTMIPIMAELVVGKDKPAPPETILIYGIWVFFPLLMLFRCMPSPMFPTDATTAKKKK